MCSCHFMSFSLIGCFAYAQFTRFSNALAQSDASQVSNYLEVYGNLPPRRKGARDASDTGSKFSTPMRLRATALVYFTAAKPRTPLCHTQTTCSLRAVHSRTYPCGARRLRGRRHQRLSFTLEILLRIRH